MTQADFRMPRCGVAGIHAVEARTRRSFARHTHEQFGLGVIMQGAHTSHSGRGKVEAARGDTITVNPGEVHDGAPVGGAERTWKILYFEPAIVGNISADISEGKSSAYEFSFPVIRSGALAAHFHRLYAAVTGGGMNAQSLLCEESLLLLLADARCARADAGKRLMVPAAIRTARALIDDDPCAAVSLEDLSRVTGLSRFQVVRGFSRALGMTPHAYLIQRRIDAARRMIAHGSPLAEAAAGSGFADQSHMTRIFVRKYGISPRAYADAIS
ncbi:AraC family transcriptional regulator [Noviherbaspirillum sp. CPCC 100848]|uniref:AraC family transcriptional regulator n=1 Tax=Noviherbaspirillum album TaxID=3080276 RepID=A0ABU6J8Q7_9BURK|nr:AraC family transcriptional regulator [Noviherbaspirillum sp. CPCC 100848]MEC4719811.1 AraC family transcriptional regulator [Noviherbaspirillum sp. CPCC 100848]